MLQVFAHATCLDCKATDRALLSWYQVKTPRGPAPSPGGLALPPGWTWTLNAYGQLDVLCPRHEARPIMKEV